ncbi:hypothetical protein PPTG_08700 [Phytophthora nicotianae INRA-310]|uniref:Crinkler effector protein N-terminal domain-containing protein n=1 Tax=Phytophthora nicotianae (strain INRA-310) TaxID=761204 RepID=W2QP60_PHYN3|nr:hypothetical protein PPTG_08700 [Phytophthora nicotianae INRA-310]ETN14045.1 hypothetical protein PPTG_08700 [Phytophthora nicotianae INRA-310]
MAESVGDMNLHSRIRGTVVKLFCAVVGVAGSVFEVDIDDGVSVAALKKAIKGENPATITCDAKDLQPFLAKKDEAWQR